MFRSTISPTTARCRLAESFGHSLPAGRSLSPVDPCRVPSCVRELPDYADRLVRSRSPVRRRRRLRAFASGRADPLAFTRFSRSLPISRVAPKVPLKRRLLTRPRSPPISVAATIEPRTAVTATDAASAPTSCAPESAARAVVFTRFTAPVDVGSLARPVRSCPFLPHHASVDLCVGLSTQRCIFISALQRYRTGSAHSPRRTGTVKVNVDPAPI